MSSNQTSLNRAKLPKNDLEQHATTLEIEAEHTFDCSKTSQWLRAAVRVPSDDLVSTASLMMGIGAVKQDLKVMILSGFGGLVAGACRMAIGEFVSVYSQLVLELAQMNRERERMAGSDREGVVEDTDGEQKEGLPNPLQAAAASALAFSVVAMVPLLAPSLIREFKVRIGVVVTAVTVALAVFGWLRAVLGKAPVLRFSLRDLFGGWMAMFITFGLTKLIGTSGL